MFSNRRELISSFRLSEKEFNIVALGFTFYLLLSFFRSFIYVGVIFIVEIFPQEVGLILSVLPIIGFFIPLDRQEYGGKILAGIQIIWILILLLSQAIIQYFLLIIGLIGISFIIKILLYSQKVENIPYSIFFMVIIDQVIKGLNRGTDPIIGGPLFNKIVIIFVSTLLFFVFWQHQEDIVYEERNVSNLNSPQSYIVNAFSIFGLIFNILIYFMFFSSPGILYFTLNMTGPFTIVLFMMIIGLTVLVVANQWQEAENYLHLLIPTTSIFLILSIYFMPWSSILTLIFWLLGTEAVIFAMMLNLKTLMTHRLEPLQLAVVLAIATIINNGFVFLMLSSDDLSIRIFLVVLATVCTSLSYFIRRANQ